MTRGWWRRNVVGLILVPPLVAGLFALNAGRAYELNYTKLPKQPVPVDGTGTARLDDYAIRLVEVTPVTSKSEVSELLGSGASPLPSAVKIWRAVIAVDAAKDVGRCQASLVDAAGRAYPMGPAELRGGPISLGGCYPDDKDQPSPYTATTYYLLPAEASPTALRLVWADRLPRYVRLSVAP